MQPLMLTAWMVYSDTGAGKCLNYGMAGNHCLLTIFDEKEMAEAYVAEKQEQYRGYLVIVPVQISETSGA